MSFSFSSQLLGRYRQFYVVSTMRADAERHRPGHGEIFRRRQREVLMLGHVPRRFHDEDEPVRPWLVRPVQLESPTEPAEPLAPVGVSVGCRQVRQQHTQFQLKTEGGDMNHCDLQTDTALCT